MSKDEKSEMNGKVEMYDTVGMNRRNFMRATVATAGVAAFGAYGVRNVRAIAPLLLAGGVAAAGAGIGIGYATARAVDYFTGDDFDEAEFDGLTDSETHALIREILLDARAADDSALTNLKNVLDLATNASYNDAQAAAVEQMDLGNTEQQAIDAATAAIDDFYDTQAKNLIDHVAIQGGKFERIDARIANSGLVYEDVLVRVASDGTSEPSLMAGNAVTVDETLPSGTTYTVNTFEYNVSGWTGTYQILPSASNNYSFGVTPVDTGTTEVYYDMSVPYGLWNTINNQHSTVISDITSWIQTVYPNYQSGDIDLNDLVTSSQFAASAAEQDGYAHSSADLGLLGLPLSNAAMEIDLPQSDAIVKGTLSARNPPEGGFDVGVEYDPANISGPVWMAYNHKDSDGNPTSSVVNLQEPFIIREARSTDGTSLSNVTMESRNQRTLETDITALNEELRQLLELQLELQELQKQEALESSDSTSSGGSLISDDSGFLTERFAGVPGWAWLTAGIGGMYAFAHKEN